METVNLPLNLIQNTGHLLLGGDLASCNHVLSYGFRTMRGRIGGVSVDVWQTRLKRKEAASAARRRSVIA